MADIKVFISSVQREFERERRLLCVPSLTRPGRSASSRGLPHHHLAQGKSVRPFLRSVKYHTKTLEQYINKLVYAGRLRPTNAKSHDQNRKYITAHSD